MKVGNFEGYHHLKKFHRWLVDEKDGFLHEDPSMHEDE